MAKNKKTKSSKSEPVIENRRARHDYAISETLEVGIALVGTEVKAVRAGRVSLNEGFVLASVEPTALTLHQVSIGEYGPGGTRQHKLDRVRMLLAHKREIRKIARQLDTKGVTVVPLKMYFKEGRVKLLIGIGTGRATHDKRRAIAERESKRELQRLMSRRG
ncbi:MAG: SsrA-binding protein SmpB [Planctomycetota bacterium]|nr:MAG: SsrA-binding protein SmpB [Planctomycetota bacterium]